MKFMVSFGDPAPLILKELIIYMPIPIDPKAKLFLHYGDITDSGQLTNLIYDIQPNEIYHLGAQSHVRVELRYAGVYWGCDRNRYNSIVRGNVEEAGSRRSFIRRPLAKCSEIHPLPKTSKHGLNPGARMVLPRSMLIGWLELQRRLSNARCQWDCSNHRSPEGRPS